MSVTVSSCTQINMSPLNQSKTKQLYSFAKNNRFGKLENTTSCEVAFYQLPEVKSQRKAGFGYGQKYDFTQGGQKTPAPNSYNIKSEVERNQNKGFSLGLGRDTLKTGGILNNTLKNPGPGTYENKNQLSNISFSMRPKTQNIAEYSTAKSVPGPGAYNYLPSINSTGNFFISKYKNSQAGLINPARQSRFGSGPGSGVTKETAANPGPGQYRPKIDMSGDGKYYVSQFQSSGCRSFSHSVRKSEKHGHTNEKTPGVGSYRLPSEFGYYESQYAQNKKNKL